MSTSIMAAEIPPVTAAAAAAAAASPCIYAEFLPKLNRISLVVHLPTPSTHSTKALVSADGSRLIIHHGGASSELVLPATARLAGEHLPGEIAPGLVKVSWRLVPSPGNDAGDGGDAVPWSAADLRAGAEVSCRACGAVIVARDRLAQGWKDLPSENWAEMMEFWHCHKPVEHDDDDGAEAREGDGRLAERGYGANSAIVARSAVGFVDLTTVLLRADDCRCLMMQPVDRENGLQAGYGPAGGAVFLSASCLGCCNQLGYFDVRKNGYSLFKWKIHISDKAGENPQSLSSLPTLSHCLAAALIATQARSGSAKVVLRGEAEAVTVWILNSHIRFSCEEKQKVSAMKLLFQDKAMDEEEINLPDEAVKEIRQLLHDSNRFLPVDEKTARLNPREDPWTVALLERLVR